MEDIQLPCTGVMKNGIFEQYYYIGYSTITGFHVSIESVSRVAATVIAANIVITYVLASIDVNSTFIDIWGE